MKPVPTAATEPGMVRGVDSDRGKWGRVAGLAGLLGSLIIAVASVITGLGYVGSMGESYSPFSHYISELGELSNSELAAVFNGALMLSGACLAAFMLGAWLATRRATGLVAGVIGAAGGLCAIGVGRVTMDAGAPHALLALGYFGLSAVAVLVFTFSPTGRQIAPDWATRVCAVLAAGALGGYVTLYLTDTSGVNWRATRGAFRLDATVEWLSLVALTLWVLLVSLRLLRAAQGAPHRPVPYGD